MAGLAQDSVVRLRIGLLGAIGLYALACCIQAACGGAAATSYGTYGGGSASFPFSGPTCPDGPPGVERDIPCGQCSSRACATELECTRTDCGNFFPCACACPLNDFNCQNACPLTPACQACISLNRDCFLHAAMTTCSAACPGG
ncbi:MAG: hypothetical protein JOZ69_14185 [Myxococcales bacterium]|nr:hypothetical protein [Myxococcales bacterium]